MAVSGQGTRWCALVTTQHLADTAPNHHPPHFWRDSIPVYVANVDKKAVCFSYRQDDHKHRGLRGGWKFQGLPWTQE